MLMLWSWGGGISTDFSAYALVMPPPLEFWLFLDNSDFLVTHHDVGFVSEALYLSDRADFIARACCLAVNRTLRTRMLP